MFPTCSSVLIQCTVSISKYSYMQGGGKPEPPESCLNSEYIISPGGQKSYITPTCSLDYSPLYLNTPSLSLCRIASVKQLLGELPEAVIEYTSVLDIDGTYTPALKGKTFSFIET